MGLQGTNSLAGEWQTTSSHHPNGRILIVWKEDLVQLDIVQTTEQAIHCLATCKSSAVTFYISFIYAFNTPMGRRPLWHNLRRFRYASQNPWILLGDFNNVLSTEERINGQPVSMYETREFKECCYDLGLSDMRSTGVFHTWTNNKIWCKLDRAMVNSTWLRRGFKAQANFELPGILSDHSPCTITILGDNDRGASPFKFFNMWAIHENFLKLVNTSWGEHIRGSAMFRLCTKLKTLKDPLKSLNRHHFAHISARAQAAAEELVDLQKLLYDIPTDIQLQVRVSDLRSKAIKLAEAEASYCSQLAKAKYLKNCDRGTKFFHGLIKSRRAKSSITSITLESRERSNSNSQVSEAFVRYYKGLLGTKGGCTCLNFDIVARGRRLDQDQVQNLTQQVTEEEIKMALFAIGEDKAPGPDGYTSCFFKKAWDIVGRDFVEAVMEFFSSGQILRQLNHSVLALIPKSKDADRVEDYRPIACYLRKAFDSVDWEFIRGMLIALNFPPIFIGWIMTCVTTTSYSLSFNGSLHGFFQGQRGLRQGDPLSPYLFVLCLEYLSRSLDELKSIPDFNFHPRCGGLKITHLAYADDLILLSRGDPTSVSLIMGKLKQFGDCSGLKISLSKSSLYTAGISPGDLETIKGITGFPQGAFPFKYLGIPVAASRLTITQFSPLIDKISDYISAWAGASLSYAGRAELIKSVLHGVECYWLSILPIPVGVREKVNQLCRNFLWSGKATVNKKPLVAWKEVTLPKHEGGLGIRNTKAWNKALISKNSLGYSSQEGFPLGPVDSSDLYEPC
ncbi:hypothetical protein Acr_23g0014170 [Actinidia rufa]|uniref:Reverse transcriptase domain-containing protein n=1 Tax=Actinidia rufa TaxID=165716 RepID=A0A7J0GQF6_9ERIC|nr:hypothetical protein Acr_23g0014170 [Actinidia rufa]